MRFGITTRDFLNNREFAHWFSELDRSAKNFNPACDIEENESDYSLSFDLPGVLKEDVKVEVVDKTLTISGERKFEKKDDKFNRHIGERYYGNFERSFTLPTPIDAAAVQATYRNGGYTLRFPRQKLLSPARSKLQFPLRLTSNKCLKWHHWFFSGPECPVGDINSNGGIEL